ADLAFRQRPCEGCADRDRGPDRRCDEADLEADEDRDGAVQRGAAGLHPCQPRQVPRAAHRRDRDRGQCRSRPPAVDEMRGQDMNSYANFEGLEVGYDIPALPGMDEADIQTPCLVLDLDALERNIVK